MLVWHPRKFTSFKNYVKGIRSKKKSDEQTISHSRRKFIYTQNFSKSPASRRFLEMRETTDFGRLRLGGSAELSSKS